jgi:hypothetical protein
MSVRNGDTFHRFRDPLRLASLTGRQDFHAATV